MVGEGPHGVGARCPPRPLWKLGCGWVPRLFWFPHRAPEWVTGPALGSVSTCLPNVWLVRAPLTPTLPLLRGALTGTPLVSIAGTPSPGGGARAESLPPGKGQRPARVPATEH